MVYIVTPILYFGFNLWDSQSFPEVLGSGLYTTNHTRFDIDSLLRPDNTLDTAKWESSKPMLLTPFCKSNEPILAFLLSCAPLTCE